MKPIGQFFLLIMFLVVPVAGADESDLDAPDLRERPQQRPSRGPQLPPPLRVFDEDNDGALSPDEIQKLADKLNALDQDGDGRVDSRELEEIFSGYRDRGPRSRDAFDQDALDDRSDRRRDGPPPEGRRRRAPDREGNRFDREDSDRDEFDDELDPHREPPPRRRPVDEDRGRNDRPQRRDSPGSGNGHLIDRLYHYDTDGDGKLSAHELPARAQWLIEQADADQDGSVDRRELEKFLSNR